MAKPAKNENIAVTCTIRTPASKFNDVLFNVIGYKDGETHITGNTLQGIALDHIETAGQAVFCLGHMLSTALMSTLSGNETAIGNAMDLFRTAARGGGFINGSGVPSDQMRNEVAQLNPIVIVWLDALRSHGRYVDTLFSISNSKCRTKLLGLLKPTDELAAMFSGGGEWNKVLAAVGQCQEVSKGLAERFMAQRNSTSFGS